MKKILFSLLAAAAITACTKSGIEYDQPDEIGFVPVAKLNTKAAVNSTDYPDGLNMYVFAKAGLDGNNSNTVEASECTEDYFNNAEFSHKTGDKGDASNVFSGVTPYYWPNVKKLIFSGYSKSGNVADLTKKPTYDGNKITIEGYKPGAGTDVEGDNDLMWFPTTAPVGRGDKAAGQELVDGNVDVTMKHACAWVTIILKGDAVTASTTTPWNVEGLKVLGLSQQGKVTLGTTADWSTLSETKELVLLDLNKGAKISEARPLTTTGEDYTKNDWGAKVKDLIVIPQPVKSLEVSYNFVSQKISDSEKIVIDETLPISLTSTTSAPASWEAGKHYTYTITLTAQQILVEPTVTGWDTTTSVPEVTL